MGYHLINIVKGVLKHYYVSDLRDLLDRSDITKNTIIYQGEPEWIPKKMGEDTGYKLYVDEWSRVGLKAQILFKKLAEKEGLILEELSQDQDSFKSYTKAANRNSIPIKRGDFLLRNAGNWEIEVK